MLAPLVATFAVLAAAQPPPISEADLEKRFPQLLSPDAATRLSAAQAIVTLPPEAMEVLAKRLARPLQTTPDVFRRLFLEMWGQVPNWKNSDPMWIRKPEPPWTPPPRVKGQPRPQRPKPHDPEALDWLTALNELDLSSPALQVPPPDPLPPGPPPRTKPKPKPAQEPAPEAEPPPPPPPVTVEQLQLARAEAMELVALMRAIAASKRLDAVDPIFNLAFAWDGVFRDECGRQIRSMESWAVPSLIKFQHVKGPANLHLGKQRRYASYQLDRMDRARPQKAISAAPDDRSRSAIIHAYGEERALEAVEAVLGQVDAASHRVRKEARWAWLRYVTGKPPPPAPKRKRKLPGGREEEEEKPDYLTYREIALLALQKELQAINNEPPDPKRSAKDLTDELFAYYDRKHQAEWDEELARGQAAEQANDWKTATDHYGWILAHDPNYAQKAVMARAFARQGDALRQSGKRAEAVGFYRQAVDLDPDGPEASQAGARAALLDGLAALELGHSDPASFRRALALDPSLVEAKEGLARAEWLNGKRVWLGRLEGLLVLAGLGLALWLLWRRVQPKAPVG